MEGAAAHADERATVDGVELVAGGLFPQPAATAETTSRKDRASSPKSIFDRFIGRILAHAAGEGKPQACRHLMVSPAPGLSKRLQPGPDLPPLLPAPWQCRWPAAL